MKRLTLCLLLAACSAPVPGPGAIDAGADARPSDAARADTGPTDAWSSDALDASALPIDAAIAVEDTGPLPDAGGACPPRPLVGLFVWNDDLVTTQGAILDLAAAHDVTEIYLHANLFYAGHVPESVLADWIRAASARCIAVELLFGNARWLLPADRAQATLRTEWAVAYAARHPDARPSGVHWDLEPQQLAEWRTDVPGHPLFVAELVTTLEAMTPVAEAGGLPLSIDMGFFLDDLLVTRASRTRPGSEWITDAVSRVVVMDYRDSALSRGFGGMISLAQPEMTYASSVSVPMVIAAETNPDPTYEYVSFAEEGYAAMLAELGVVRTTFAGESAFVGVAIHDRDGLAALGP